ncbi:hypothetical protein SAMN04244572_03848 [Azotobacter beijerinckii]|uniref:Transposase n=1 Tax=Azotobacter beijerinckii TaxID=170623 RepID=A0A1H6XQM0_9GAMM|nr:hypothetical protein SAMN04244579_03895 [Azotobacter beijerinckii]SEJ40856.1 hypothetical protein SAMN04244572_03848 [Azotobacter beijerinckii]
MRERVKALEREVRELRQANEILRKASASLPGTSFQWGRQAWQRTDLDCRASWVT